MADYKAGLIAQREKTARLKALREAKEAADAAARAAADDAGGREAAKVNADKANKTNKIDAGKAPNPVKRSARKQVLAAERAEYTASRFSGMFCKFDRFAP